MAVAKQGSNPICLPEYDQSNNNISLRNVPPVFDFDVPGRAIIDARSTELAPVGVRHDANVNSTLYCALCFLPNLPVPTLIVGTDRCPKSGTWRLEYYGQLVTGSVSGSDFFCADLERITQGSAGSKSFAYILNSVSVECQGTSPGCTQGRRFEEIPCAICTRIS